MLNKKVITNFGIPNCLKNFDLKFCFTDSLSDELVGCGCHCSTFSTKFFLYDNLSTQAIFTMNFYITDTPLSPFCKAKTSGQRVHLQHIATNNSFRNRGIASFYITKLVDFCRINNIQTITLDVCPDSNDKMNALNDHELAKFYNSFSTDEVKIKII